MVAVLYCFHLKWNHPNSVRTRKPNNCLGIDFAKGKAKWRRTGPAMESWSSTEAAWLANPARSGLRQRP